MAQRAIPGSIELEILQNEGFYIPLFYFRNFIEGRTPFTNIQMFPLYKNSLVLASSPPESLLSCSSYATNF